MLPMRFLETPIFTRSIQGLLDDEELRALQVALLLRPALGALIRGSGGLRKLRWRSGGHGKRGGVRVIYFWHAGEAVFYLLFAYAKGTRGDFTPAQTRALRRLVQEEFR
jgi:hypothetical protein